MGTLLSILGSLGIISNGVGMANNSTKTFNNSNLEIKDNILNNDLKTDSNLKENYDWSSTKNILNLSNNLIKYLSYTIWDFISLTVYESDKFNYDD